MSPASSLIALYRPFVIFIGASLGLWLLARALLVAVYFERVSSTAPIIELIAVGLRFDIAMLSMWLAIPLLVHPLARLYPMTSRTWNRLLAIFLVGLFGFFAFMESATLPFLDEYGARPNFLFVEYLEYPREVFDTLLTAYLPELLLAALIVPTLMFGLHRWLATGSSTTSTRAWTALVLVAASVPLLTLGIRSTTGHRPINPSTAAITTDPLVNNLAMNSSYSLLYAIYEHRRDDVLGNETLTLDKEQIYTGIRQLAGIHKEATWHEGIPTLHRQVPRFERAHKLNLVIVIEESLGAEFVGSLGGRDLTPGLDALATEGIWFDNLFATGTRSVQGIEALVTGFLPTRASSTVKLSGSQRNFFTLAGLLSREGYESSFIYGGNADFDNMRRFFLNNGFNTVIDQPDFSDPTFTSSWGVSDEDLFARAHDYFSNAFGKHPFFSVVFTTSNHSPFEIPPGRIVPTDPDTNSVNNAVQYADYALADFIRKAKASDYWQDTIFLVVADHNSRVKGAEKIPIERFHIPGVILGGPISPRRITRLVSQVDLPPTLLSLLGLSLEHPAIGDDVFRECRTAWCENAVMRYHDSLGYREGNRVIIETRDGKLEQFDWVNGHLRPAGKRDEALSRRARVHFEWPVRAYRDKSYKLP